MKTILSLLLAVLLAGCASADNEARQPKPSPQEKQKEVREVEIGAFSTTILDTDESRVNNLILCAAVLNGVDVEPGETFSFNTVVGQRTEQKGYEEARILIGEEKGYAVGGGVCQISSTIYNAAKIAGMEILERHSHQNEVHYVELGSDAAVSYGELDFVFRNNTQNTVRVDASVQDGNVYAKIIKYEEI